MGYGTDESLRERLLTQAGYTEAMLAEVAKQVVDKQVALLSAQTTQFFACHGTVTDTRTVPDHRTQLNAAKALTTLLGVQAPPAKQVVTVVHTLDLPAWMQPDVLEAEVVEETDGTTGNTQG